MCFLDWSRSSSSKGNVRLIPTPPDREFRAVERRLPRRRALEILGLSSLPFSFAPGFVARAAASPTSAPMSSPVPPVPDLVNLHALLETMAREHAPRMSFLDARWSSLEDWKSAAREVLLDRLGYQPAARPLGAELVRREERDGFSVEVVRIQATEAYSIPARVLVPAGKAGRRPAVLALHCHSGRYTWGHEKVLSASGEPAF
ncbi:MAG: hypothetical protein RJB55_2332, partial [Verrucomicrobiota bacterium]